MIEENHAVTLPELLVKKTRLHWYVFTGIFAFFLLAILLLAALAEDKPIFQLGWIFWRSALQSPAILIYILILYPVLNRVGNRAFESLLPNLDMGKDELERLASRYYSPGRFGELMSLLLGAVFIVLLSQPWNQEFHFVDVYIYVIGILMFSLLALLIYYAIHNTLYMTRINRHIKIDIFDIDSLTPIARWSLSISLAFIGGIVISILFQNIEDLRQWQVIIVYVILVGTAVGVFFMSMWSTHTAIVRIKRNELDIVRQKLIAACRRLKQNSLDDVGEPDHSLYYEVGAWGLYEGQIRNVREWPLNAIIIGRLVVSAIAPALVYVVKIVSGAHPGF
jgi:hypothetical protein